MAVGWISRFGAVCGVVLGLSIGVPGLIEAVTGETAATSFVLGLGAAFGPPILTALYLRLSAGGGRFGAVADDLPAGPTRAAILLSAAVFVVGTVLFAIAMARSKAFPRPPVYAYGSAPPLLAVLAPLDDSPLISGVHVLAAGALIWLALSLWPRSVPLTTTHATSV